MTICLTPTYDTRRKPQTPGTCRQNWSHPLLRNVDGLWLLNEGGGNIRNLINGRSGTKNGTPTFAAGRYGGFCANFPTDGGDSGWDVGPYAASGGAFTISVRAVIDTPPASIGTLATSGEFGFRLTWFAGPLQLLFDLGYFGSNYSSARYIFTPDAGAFYEITATWDGTSNSGAQKIYVNGIERASTTRTQGSWTANTNLSFGYQIDSANRSLDGRIERVLTLRRGVTAAEASLLWSEPFAMLGPLQTPRTWVNTAAAATGGTIFRGRSRRVRNLLRM